MNYRLQRFTTRRIYRNLLSPPILSSVLLPEYCFSIFAPIFTPLWIYRPSLAWFFVILPSARNSALFSLPFFAPFLPFRSSLVSTFSTQRVKIPQRPSGKSSLRRCTTDIPASIFQRDATRGHEIYHEICL